VGAVTSRTAVAVGVTNPQTRHLMVTASYASTMAELTGGRFMLGFGRGINLRWDVWGVPHVTSAMLTDTVGLLRTLWRGEPVLGHDGPAGKFDYLSLDHTVTHPVPVGLAALGERHAVPGAVTVDLDLYASGECVDHRDTHAVQTTRHLVAAAAELAAGVQHGEHHLNGALALVRPARVRVYRHASAVVFYATGSFGGEGDHDAGTEPGHRLVNRVVHNLPDEVVQTGQAGRPDVHTRALSHRVEALKDLDGTGVVFH
jgi:hypothetical protein